MLEHLQLFSRQPEVTTMINFMYSHNAFSIAPVLGPAGCAGTVEQVRCSALDSGLSSTCDHRTSRSRRHEKATPSARKRSSVLGGRQLLHFTDICAGPAGSWPRRIERALVARSVDHPFEQFLLGGRSRAGRLHGFIT